MTKSTSARLTKSPGPLTGRRRGRIAKLPKMTNSERGKYYRNKNKQHEHELEHSVATLRKQVRDLELFLRVRDALLRRNPSDACASITATIYESFVRARDGQAHYDTSFQSSPSHRHHFNSSTCDSPASTSHDASVASVVSIDLPSVVAEKVFSWGDIDSSTAFVFFDLLSFHVEGSVDAPVVVMRGALHTKYTLPMIDRMFPHLLQHQDLLNVLQDKEVQYPCTYHFYFGSDGTLEHKFVEADHVQGLLDAVGNLADVMWLLDSNHKYPTTERRDSLDDMIRGPAIMSLDFILS